MSACGRHFVGQFYFDGYAVKIEQLFINAPVPRSAEFQQIDVRCRKVGTARHVAQAQAPFAAQIAQLNADQFLDVVFLNSSFCLLLKQNSP